MSPQTEKIIDKKISNLMNKILYTAIISLILATSCSKNDIFYYDAEHTALNIWLGDSNTTLDSLTYNFAYTLEGRDSIMFNVRLSGYPAEYDRPFEIEAVAGDYDYVYYKFADYVLKAGEYEGKFPIYIDKPASYDEFKDRSGAIIFKLKESATFASGTNENSQLYVVFKNYVAKPDNWDDAVYPYYSLSRYFGSYSQVKYSFIIQETGLANFQIYYTTAQNPVLADNVITSIHATYLKSKCVSALITYNATHASPLSDENGNLIVFP
jgi:hypothetical protein